MERPKQITPIAASLCLMGALMMAWSAIRSSDRLDMVQNGYGIRERNYYLDEGSVIFGVGVYLSSALILALGIWGIYIGARFVVADITALKNTKRWCRAQEFMFALYIIFAVAGASLHSFLYGNDNAGEHWIQLSSFLTAFSGGAPLCGIGPYLVARYINRNLEHPEIHKWFVAAHYSGSEDV